MARYEIVSGKKLSKTGGFGRKTLNEAKRLHRFNDRQKGWETMVDEVPKSVRTALRRR